jgi:hypothetical protein
MAQTLTEPKIGDKMPDGTIYAGISPETGRPMYATLTDDATITFTDPPPPAGARIHRGDADAGIPDYYVGKMFEGKNTSPRLVAMATRIGGSRRRLS